MFETPSRETTPKDQQTTTREAFQAAEQFLLRGYIPPPGGLGGEHNDVDFGAGDPKRRNEVFRMEAGGMPDTKAT